MPRGRPHRNVPVFSQREINIAEACALSLWNGIDYESVKRMEKSDSDFLAEYAIAFNAKRRNQNISFAIDELSLRRLIRVGKLKAMFRSANPLDFANGLTVTESLITQYDAFLKKHIHVTPAEFAKQISIDLGKSFVTWARIPTINGNYRIPFASRILFFGFPNLPIFNFSNGLSSKMHFQSRPQDALPHYYRELGAGLVRNAARLSALKPPPIPAGMSPKTWQTILQNKWWQRRVLDIALLLHFRVTKVAPAVLQNAGLLAAVKKKSAKRKK